MRALCDVVVWIPLRKYIIQAMTLCEEEQYGTIQVSALVKDSVTW